MNAMRDFPFCTDRPVALSGREWLILLGALAVGFGLLSAAPLMGFPASAIPPLLFLGMPLLALRRVAGRHWTVLFGPIGPRQVAQLVLFGLLTLAHVVTRNLWVSAETHILNDWSGFLAAFAFAHLPIGPDPV
ncbi:hypothetical protein IE00_10790 [Paracoccus sp. SM22M-07]|nr:hypothetical protein IE00_10790 [Paracoccus sp. SM22M-07]